MWKLPAKKESSKHAIEYGSQIIVYNLIRDRRKRLRIVVSHERNVSVFAPVNASLIHIHDLVRKKASWIVKTFDKIEKSPPLPEPTQYVSGENLVYLGERYQLRIERGEYTPVKLDGDYLYIGTKGDACTVRIKKRIDEWYREQAKGIFRRYIKTCLAIAPMQGTPEPFLSIRKMRRRWGSCRPSGRITLNLHLVKLPVECIEYVIMHELCHLRHPNHSNNFYTYLAECLPDWKKRKKAMDMITFY